MKLAIGLHHNRSFSNAGNLHFNYENFMKNVIWKDLLRKITFEFMFTKWLKNVLNGLDTYYWMSVIKY